MNIIYIYRFISHGRGVQNPDRLILEGAKVSLKLSVRQRRINRKTDARNVIQE
uniref:Uncharacterized protein n=1 Tax=Oryza sativa subsp. japonica TaxID=39947 RepID=Q6H6T2_ORYSJ|nr:hypothetical protein [Oryza sativa Japonica Group]BAD25567.1 hypothetical protein [Oryza sativa Japonica Group]